MCAELAVWLQHHTELILSLNLLTTALAMGWAVPATCLLHDVLQVWSLSIVSPDAASLGTDMNMTMPQYWRQSLFYTQGVHSLQ